MHKKLIKILWSLIGSVLLLMVVLTVCIWNGWIGYMPPIEDLQNPIDKYASQVYSSDGKLIGTWNMNKENRIGVPYDSISPNVVRALVATEDERFYEHSGIDFYALARAVVKRGIMGQTNAGGGSTITQQLAKQLYSDKAESTLQRLFQKPIEWIIALKLERNYTKSEIITMYLNYFDFLHNAVGIKMASKTYFSKLPRDLSLVEAATLVGMCKNPSMFNPVRYPDRAKERRNVVLSQMVKNGSLIKSEYESLSNEPLVLNFHTDDHRDGYAAYFREFLRKYISADQPVRSKYPDWNYAQYVVDSVAWCDDPLYGWCNKNFKRDGTPYNIYTDGLKIHTTIDTRMQEHAEAAVREHMIKEQKIFYNSIKGRRNAPYSSRLSQKTVSQIIDRTMRRSERWRADRELGMSDEEIRADFNKKYDMTVFSYHGDVDTVMTPLDSIMYYKKFLRVGFASMDVHTGEMKAYVGGLDYHYFQYDIVMLGRRQVGSTIKPYLYSLAMDNGLTPCDGISNSSAFSTWHVNGASGGFGPIRNMLQHSRNGAATQLMKRFSPDGKAFVQWLKKFGVLTPGVVPGPTLALGSCDVSIGEMLSGYTAFANGGIRCAPLFVTKIVDSEGNIVATFQPRMNEVMSAESSYKMIDMMRAVVHGGTGSRITGAPYNIHCDMGAKTGTTNLNADAWFMAYTPDLVNGCWVGGEDRDIHIENGSLGQGAAAALPLWAYYMRRIFADKRLGYSPDKKFDIPQGYNPCGNGNRNNELTVEDVFE